MAMCESKIVNCDVNNAVFSLLSDVFRLALPSLDRSKRFPPDLVMCESKITDCDVDEAVLQSII